MYTLYTDGGARGNPGPAAIGYVLFDVDMQEIDRGNRYIGERTNNYAEYMGLIAGLQSCLNKEAKNITCYLDSELVVKQLNGDYKVKNEGLKPLFDMVNNLKGNFSSVSFNHVPRSENKIADGLVNQALDEHLEGK